MPAATVSDLHPPTPRVGIFDPFQLRGMRLPNRVLMAPMEKNLCTADGVMTQRYIDYLVARARGGDTTTSTAASPRSTRCRSHGNSS